MFVGFLHHEAMSSSLHHCPWYCCNCQTNGHISTIWFTTKCCLKWRTSWMRCVSPCYPLQRIQILSNPPVMRLKASRTDLFVLSLPSIIEQAHGSHSITTQMPLILATSQSLTNPSLMLLKYLPHWINLQDTLARVRPQWIYKCFNHTGKQSLPSFPFTKLLFTY